MNGLRSFMYTLSKWLGDANAVGKGKVGRRVGRRVAGRATGKGLGKVFR